MGSSTEGLNGKSEEEKGMRIEVSLHEIQNISSALKTFPSGPVIPPSDFDFHHCERAALPETQ